MFQSYGYLKYDPRHENTRADPWWIILQCDKGISLLYRSFIEKEATKKIKSSIWLGKRGLACDEEWMMTGKGIILSGSAWGSHISVNRGDEPAKNKDLWGKYEGEEIKFEYDPGFLNTNERHWWIRVQSKRLEEIRQELGFSRLPSYIDYEGKTRYVHFHITIGRDVDKKPSVASVKRREKAKPGKRLMKNKIRKTDKIKAKQQKIFVTGDTHFFHENILIYCDRPFKSTKEMAEVLIRNWNSVVGPNDLVYHFGDFAFGGPRRAEELAGILFRLNGSIRLLKGNHESYVLKSPCVERFEWVKDYYELKYTSPNHGKRKFIMQHYPLYTWNGAGRTDKQDRAQVICLHGHCHGNIDGANLDTTRMDVGVDSNGYTPVWIENIIEIMNYRRYKPVDHHSKTTN